MIEKLKKLLEKIRNSDEATKKRWLMGTAAVSMAVVVALWLVYVNADMKLVPEIKDAGEPSTGFWQIFKNGLNVVFGSIKDGVTNLISEITKSRTITIE